MSLFQDIIEQLGKTQALVFSVFGETIHIHHVYATVILTFHEGENQLSKLQVQISGRMMVTQTYSAKETWALYKQELKTLVLFSHQGKTEIVLT